MKIYIAGKITGLENFEEIFAEAENELKSQGHKVINPAVLVLPPGFEHQEYMHVCYAMIDVCDAVYMLRNWTDSPGAIMENGYAGQEGKEIWYQPKTDQIGGTT